MSLLQNLTILLAYFVSCSADYYTTLGVRKDATSKEIRSAFKKLALTLHPDKNKDDPNAETKFMSVNEAYEILKDEALRRKYDLYGEEGLKENRERQQRRERQSYQYYREDFDIYGDDAEIITLTTSDFKNLVENRGESVWFINFYSPRCSHCHEIAPMWRTLGKEMEGVIRIGAVNCQDSWNICRHLRGYPSLYLYSSKGQREYSGARDVESLVEFLMTALPPAPVITMFSETFKKAVTEVRRPWLLSFCGASDDCISRSTLDRVAVALNNLVYVGSVNCDTNRALCEKLAEEPALLVFNKGVPGSVSVATILRDHSIKIASLHTQEVIFTVLKNLPPPPHLTDTQYTDIVEAVTSGSEGSAVIIMTKDNVPLEFIKLRVKDMQIRQLDCGTYKDTCDKLHVTRHPTLMVFKQRGYERYHGRQDAGDMATFITESVSSTLIELTPAHFPHVTTQQYVVDYFAPWCPPCMQLLPELRKAAAAKSSDQAIQYGTVDCAIHSTLCARISSYPSLVFYNNSTPHTASGYKTQHDIAEFISDILHPAVIDLNNEEWMLKINNKSTDEVWLVDYFAPWCGPCRQLAPTWNKLGKYMQSWNNTHVAKVDCTLNRNICDLERVTGYPTIRVYRAGSRGRASYSQYNGWGQLNDLKGWAMSHLPSIVEVLDAQNYMRRVLQSRTPWLVQFYNPMCAPCQRFAPQYESLAARLRENVQVGKVDCNKHSSLCYKVQLRGFPTLFFYSGASSHQQGMRGVEVPTTTADEIYQHLLRHYPYIKHGNTMHMIRDEL